MKWDKMHQIINNLKMNYLENNVELYDLKIHIPVSPLEENSKQVKVLILKKIRTFLFLEKQPKIILFLCPNLRLMNFQICD